MEATVSQLVGKLTIQSEEFARSLTVYLTTRGKDYQSAFALVEQNLEGQAQDLSALDALVPLHSAIGAVITRSLNRREDRPGYLQMLHERLEDGSILTQFEGKFIPMLFTGQIDDDKAEWRRDVWKDILNDDVRISFLRDILDTLRSDEHKDGIVITKVEFEVANDMKDNWGFSTAKPFIQVMTAEQTLTEEAKRAWIG